MRNFSIESKSAASYIDEAANGHGDEKSQLLKEAYRRVASFDANDISLLEIGPGGGSALKDFVSDISGGDKIRIHTLELDGVESAALEQSLVEIAPQVANVSIHRGNIVDLDTFFDRGSMDIISTSALMHEVYSYSGGYTAIDNALRGISTVLAPGGFYAYRDVYAVQGLSLHERARHVYDRTSWVAFCGLFLDYYLENANHPYSRYADRVKLSQLGETVNTSAIDATIPLSIEAPVGLLRELQRHYITLRDLFWRRGSLGIKPELDCIDASSGWLDKTRGHRRIRYQMLENDPMLEVMSHAIPDKEDFYVADGDIFDKATDIRMGDALLDIISNNDQSIYWEGWSEWVQREGSETYCYMTIGELLSSVALNSFEATHGQGILLPASEYDVAMVERAYYNRYLRSKLSNPLPDGKQLVLFEMLDIQRNDTELQQKAKGALGALSIYCSRDSISDIYKPLRRIIS